MSTHMVERTQQVPVELERAFEFFADPHNLAEISPPSLYRLWVHPHRLTPRAGGTETYDHVRYRVPGGAPVERVLVRPLLVEIFDHRRDRIAELLGA